MTYSKTLTSPCRFIKTFFSQVSLALLITGISLAGHVDAQEVLNKKVSLKMESRPLTEILSGIEKQVDIKFTYRAGLLSELQLISVDYKSEKLVEVLKHLLPPRRLKYKIIGSQIVLSHMPGHENSRTEPETQTVRPDKRIQGSVTDEKGEGLPGVNVLIKHTQRGTVSDAAGKFDLEIPEDGVILVLSYVGYLPQEILVGNKTELSIRLTIDNKALEEVLVVGYGTQKKSDLTGSVSTVSGEALKNRPVMNFGEALTGQVAGLQIQQIDGTPGGENLSIRVRGVTSITQSNEPLYVVDGYPMESGALALLNPSNIENIQVLKDASSTAIYGSRGANGVVIITTKKGKTGAPVVNFNTFVGVQQRAKNFQVMNREQYVQYFVDARNNAWLDAAVIPSDPDQSPHSLNDSNDRRMRYPSANSQYIIPDGKNGFKYNFLDPASVAQMPDNNWQDLLFRNAITQQHDLTISGGSDKTRYAFSTSYKQQDGVVLNTDYDRINVHANIASQISRRLQIGMNINSYYAKSNEQPYSGYETAKSTNNDLAKNAIMWALELPPIYPIRNPDGSYGSMINNPEILPGDVANPIGYAVNSLNRRIKNGFMGTFFAELALTDHLRYNINVNAGLTGNGIKRFMPAFGDDRRAPAYAINERLNDIDWVIENTLTYNRTFAGKHSLTALAGYTTQKHTYEHVVGEARNFASDQVITLNGGTMYALSSDESAYSMISYLARVNYGFANKYLLTATIRSDGSSRFGSDKRWGIFPSVGLGWRIIEESFLKNSRFLSDLKLRGSFGVSGNNRIGNYSSIGLLSVAQYPVGNILQNTVGPISMSNNTLSWEKIRESNLGLEMAVLNNRIRLEADIYDRKSIDLLLNVPIPSVTGHTNQMQNIGKVRNRGFELLISTTNTTGAFRWNSDLNFSLNRNKVLELGPDGRPIYANASGGSNAFITTIGQPVASFFGYIYEGVFMSQDDLDRYPHLPVDKIGSGRYRDVDGNKIMDANDRVILGNNQPKFTAGFNNNFSYKNFSLGMQWYASYGAKLLSTYNFLVGTYHGDRNGKVDLVDRWRSAMDPGSGVNFRATRTPTGWQRSPSSAWINDGSYLRLRNLMIAYDFKTDHIKALKMNNLRLYATGQNLITITRYPGYDPESSIKGDGLNKGYDLLAYPVVRSVVVGINASF